MKIIFLIDNISAITMFRPIIAELPANCETQFVNYFQWSDVGKDEIDRYLLKLGLRIVKGQHLVNARKLIEEENPNVIVLSRDTTTTVEQSFIENANSKRIPTLLVPHGMWSPGERKIWTFRRIPAWMGHLRALGFQGLEIIRNRNFSWRQLFQASLFFLRRDLVHTPTFDGHGGCTRIAVFGNAMKELLLSEGIDPEHISVTGNPKFDLIFNAKKNSQSLDVCRKPTISPCESIVLVLTDYLVEVGMWTAGQRKQYIMAIANAVRRLPKCKLVIKIHPLSESVQEYRSIFKDISNQPLICQQVSLPYLLNMCDLAITVMSTAGLEAMAMGKPLIVFNLFNNLTPFDGAKGVIEIQNENDLLPALRAVIDNGLSIEKKRSADDYVFHQAYLQDGKAARRIANLIVQMASEFQQNC